MFRKNWSWVMVVAAGGAVGCGSTKMTPSGPEQAAREPSCDFRVYTTAPEGYAEVAVIDVQPGGYGHKVFTDISDFKDEIRASVCQAGGDAVIAYANGYGMYIKAAVLKELPGGAKPAAASAAAEPAAPPPPAASAPQDGCRYDTQCKGERVCVKGECVDPAPPAAPVPAPAPAVAAPVAASAAPAAAVPPAAPASTAAPKR